MCFNMQQKSQNKRIIQAFIDNTNLKTPNGEKS